jgi:hypothetical protein
LAKQDFNASAGLRATVNSLSDNYGGIGLGITSNYSMLSEEETKSFPVYVQGDYVTITVKNPNGEEALETSPEELTLQNYSQYSQDNNSLYTFSGSHFTTDGPLTIVPTRVKMSSGEINHDTMVYGIDLFSGYTNVYYDSRHLGNPANKAGNPEYPRGALLNWDVPEFMTENSFLYSELINGNGISINGYKISATPTFITPSISYFVISPPYGFMNQRSIAPTIVPEEIPFDSEENLSNNISVAFAIMGYENDSQKVYNPFSNTSYDYIDQGTTNGVQSISFNSAIINNVTLTDNSNKKASKYATNPNNNNRVFAVEGNYLTLNMFLGLSGETNQAPLGELYARNPASRLLFIDTQNDNNSDEMWKDESLSDLLFNYKNGVGLKIKQQLSDVFIPALNDSEMLDTNSTPTPGNITLTMSSFFITEDFHLDLQAGDGLRAVLYNSSVSFDSTTGQGTVTVNKYPSLSIIDFHSVDSYTQLQTTLLFTRKYSVPYNIPSPVIPENTVLNISSNLSNIDTDNTISWDEDTTFSGTEWAQILLYKKQSMNSILPQLFVTQSTGEPKAFYTTKAPAMVINGKVGNTLFQVNSDGSIFAPSTSVLRGVFNRNTGNIKNNLDGADLRNYMDLFSIVGYKAN